MNWKPFLLGALLLVLPATLPAADPISCREIAMLLRNGEDQQFILRDTARRKLLHALSAEDEQTLLSLRATPALISFLHDPANIVAPDAAAAYAARLEQQKKQVTMQARAEQMLAQQQAAETLQKQYPKPGAESPPGAANEYLGKPLTLKFNAADGTAIDLANLRGKVVLLDFWATWCGPCMKEVPNVIAAYKQYHERGFEIVGISLDQNKETMQKVAAQKGMTWPQYFDGRGWNNEISSGFKIRQIPTMWLINRQGLVASTDARGSLDAAVAKLLTE